MLPPKKILIVDDNPLFVNFLVRVLEGKGYEISVAYDGQTGIQKVRQNVPDLILLDLKLPDLSGEEVLEKIRATHKQIPIIVVTGHGGEQVAVEMMKKGATDYLSKPIDFEILLKSIQDAIEIKEGQLQDMTLGEWGSLEFFFPLLAHEVRNPLHAISGALTIIKRRSNLNDHMLTQSIRIIEEEVQHLNHFVQECLNFVRPPNPVLLTEIDINEVVSIVVNMMTHIFDPQARGITVIEEKGPQLPKIYANYEELKQAFLNLGQNAIEAMPNGGTFTITTSFKIESAPKIEILFKDTGMGIRPENMKKLFRPFFTTKQRGTGLGLAICRRIIEERHGGRISVTTEENQGTTFKVELPVHPKPEGI